MAQGKETERQVAFDEIEPFLQNIVAEEPEMYIALYADENIPYGEVVKVLDIAKSFTAEELKAGVVLKRGKKNFNKIILK